MTPPTVSSSPGSVSARVGAIARSRRPPSRGRLDELPELARVLAARAPPRRRSTRRRPTAAPSRIASPTLSGVSPPASRRRTPPGAPSASRQSKTLPEPGVGRVDEDRRRPGCSPRPRARDRRPRTPGSRSARARGSTAPRRCGSRPCSCTACSPTARRDLDDVLGPLVAEHADGAAPRAGSRLTMSRTVSGCHLPRARREHEAERVGAERDREQRVVLVRDPADLDEHASSLLGLQASIRRPWWKSS